MAFGYLNLSFEVDGRVELDRTLHGYVARVEDWKPFFRSLAADFREMERERFAAQGAFEGEDAWAPLDETYRSHKERVYGQKPILQATGAMFEAVVNPEEKAEDLQLTLTIDSAYALYHQSDKPRESNLPRRAIIALGARRKSKWTGMMRDYIWEGQT
ncbi:MAG: phage virion morphogenesis protein [Armatimonadetes bacterium]|nr:phage virion morphogenesis protein [Armatimonadota bacterium]